MNIDQQIPGKPLEPDVDRLTQDVVELLVSGGKPLSPIGTRPATVPEVVAWLREQGAGDIEDAVRVYASNDYAIPVAGHGRYLVLPVDAALPGEV